MGWKSARCGVLRNSVTSHATALRRAEEAVAYAIVAALIIYFAVWELGVVYGLLAALAVVL
jgi:predicted anti-sigma-YlaC factor YlaD